MGFQAGVAQSGRLLTALAVFALLAAAVPIAVVRWSAGAAPAAGLDQDAVGTGPGRSNGSCAGRALAATRELRGMWLTTVANIDWPSRPGLDTDTVKAEYRSWLDLARRLGHNAVFVHVRPSGDAFWPSRYGPWSEWLTGRRDGRGPGWDPLQFMVAEAHARNLEFHAWFNPYRAASSNVGADRDKLAPTHPLRQHPEWVVTYPKKGKNGTLYYDPGIPEVRRFVEDSILDAVYRYDIDGVHFDDFFYPYPVGKHDFPDDASFARYGGGASRDDWRRDNVNRFVREMSERIKATKPWVKFGISPFGIWRNKQTDKTGSATHGMQSYDTIYADTKLWIRQQWLDYVVPQLYWHIGFDVADYAKLLPWWVNTVSGTRVQLYIGQGDYRIGESGAWSDPSQLDRQLTLNRRYGVAGSVHFSAKQLRANRLGAVNRYVSHHYATPALLPTMTQLPAIVPATPVLTKVSRGTNGGAKDAGRGATVRWRPGAGIPATSFAIYRADLATAGTKATLVGTVRRTGAAAQTWTDSSAAPGHRYAYCVTALDRVGTESHASRAGQPR